MTRRIAPFTLAQISPPEAHEGTERPSRAVPHAKACAPALFLKAAR